MSEVLFNSINKWLSKEGNKQIDITHNTGIAKSLISDVIDKKGSKDLRFSKTLSVLRYIEEDYLEVMDDYCRTLKKPVGILNSLEYASNFERQELMDDLLTEYKDHRGEVKEWVEIYRFNRDRNIMTPEVAWEKCRELYGRVTVPDAQLKLDLIETSIHFRNDQYNIRSFIDRVERKIGTLKEGFLKDSLKVKYHLNYSFVCLYENEDIDEAIMHAKEVTKSKLVPIYLVACAYHLLGHAEMYRNKELSLHNLKEAKRLYKLASSSKAAQIEQDIQFVLNVHGEYQEIESLKDEELAFQYLVRKENEKARKALETVDKKSPFALLYLGIATKDIKPIIKGYGLMKQSGNNFFAQLFERAISEYQ
ncbi:AimR family lysis-lysogeny pheromone receptor [Shouchella miscanthi]|uniref:AimR family lysis-lysogeny pheromone receptor n=1 Tax=Shouchella miscanthi TaxID=2598861 RepID=UPI0011AA1FDD|nr:AimR family lysis-lysogeny pheromone receptor [Shouchella miscanthi]